MGRPSLDHFGYCKKWRNRACLLEYLAGRVHGETASRGRFACRKVVLGVTMAAEKGQEDRTETGQLSIGGPDEAERASGRELEDPYKMPI